MGATYARDRQSTMIPESLLPLWAVVERELVSTLRRGPLFVAMGALVVGCVLLAGAYWPSANTLPLQWGTASSEFIYYLSYGLAIASVFLIPGVAGSSIVVERQRNTLDSLAITYARPAHILSAKMIASLGVFLLIVCAMCPVLAVVYFTVGVNPSVLAEALIVIVSSAVLSAAAGVYCSCIYQRTSAAIAASYIVSWSLFGLPVIAGAMFLDVLDFADMDDIFWSMPVRILPAIAVAAAQGVSRAGPSLFFGLSSVFGCCIFALVVSGLLLFMASRRVRNNWGEFAVREAPEPESERRVPQTTSGRILDDYPVYRNPIVHIERLTFFGRTSMLNRWLFAVVIAFGLTGSALLLLSAWIRHGRTFSQGCIALFMLEAFTLGILVPALLTNLFTKERETGLADSLRMTLLSPLQVYWGKVHYAGTIVWLVMAGVFVGWIPLVAGYIAYPDAIGLSVMGVVTSLECVVLGISLSVLSSVVTRRMTTALTVAYVLTFMVFIGNFLLVFLIFQWLSAVNDISQIDAAPEWTFGLSPLLAYLIGADGLSMGRMGLFGLWFASLVLYVGTSCALVGLAYPLFRRRYGKDAL